MMSIDGNDTAVYTNLKEKFSDYASKLSCLAIVPKEMIESWLLADEQAYVAAFGKKPEHLPKNPEEIWGEKDKPDSNHPKRIMDRILGQYRKESTKYTYTEIAERCSIETLKIRCPKSFGRFYDDMQGFV